MGDSSKPKFDPLLPFSIAIVIAAEGEINRASEKDMEAGVTCSVLVIAAEGEMKRASESDIDAGVAAEGEMNKASDNDIEAGVSEVEVATALGVDG